MKPINDEPDRQGEKAKVRQNVVSKRLEQAETARQDREAVKQRQKDARTAQDELDEAITVAPSATKHLDIPRNNIQVVRATKALTEAPDHFTADKLDRAIQSVAMLTTSVRNALVQEEIARRANRQGARGEAATNGPICEGVLERFGAEWTEARGPVGLSAADLEEEPASGPEEENAVSVLNSPSIVRTSRSRKTLPIIACIIIAGLCIGYFVRDHQEKMAAERQSQQRLEEHRSRIARAKEQIAEMAKQWNAAAAWNDGLNKSDSADPYSFELESMLKSSPAVVFLGTVDDVQASPAVGQFIVKVDDSADRLDDGSGKDIFFEVNLTCSQQQVGQFGDRKDPYRSSHGFAFVARVNSVQKTTIGVNVMTKANENHPFERVADREMFVVTGDCVDLLAIPDDAYSDLIGL